jgi:hypothetical protein
LIAEAGDYVYSLEAPSEDEAALLEEATSGETGALVMISKIHQSNMTSPGEVVDGLKKTARATYFYALRDKGIELTVIDTKSRLLTRSSRRTSKATWTSGTGTGAPCGTSIEHRRSS